MELRAYTFLDSLQPQLVAFLQTVCTGFMPMEQQASVLIEIAPGIAINQLTDAALKATRCEPWAADRPQSRLFGIATLDLLLQFLSR